MADNHHHNFVELTDIAVSFAASVDGHGLLLLLLFDEVDIFDDPADVVVFVKDM